MSQHDQRQATASATSRPTVLDVHGYKVGKTLGHGSYATVKESYSSRHKCKVAIKIISKRRAPGDYLDKFLPREIDVVKLLKHPNLVVFLQSIETNNRVYLIMENASGGDLLDTIRSEKYIQEKQAGVWFDQLIEGIKYCHAKGVVHRDLKCENLLLDEYKNLKVTDFGFARSGMIKSEGSDPPLSETYCGSYAYAAPEILTGTPYVPQHADVWSCGIILYVMVFGRLPFDDSNHKKLLKQVHKGPVFPENRPVSNECKDVIRRILVKCDVRLRIPEIQAHPWYVKIDKKVVPNEESFLHQLRLKRAQDAKREKEKSEALAAKGTNIANPDGGTVSQTPSQIGGGNGQDAKKTPSDEGEDEGHAKDLHHEHDDGHPHREHSMQQREQPIPQFPGRGSMGGRGSVGGGSGGSGGSSKR